MMERSPVSMEQILTAVSCHFGVPVEDIRSTRRCHSILWPRFVAVGLAARLTHYSTPRIGRLMGGRDHSTILHAIRKFDVAVTTDPQMAADVAAIEARLGDDAEVRRARLEARLDELADDVSDSVERLRALRAQLDAASSVAAQITDSTRIAKAIEKRLSAERHGLAIYDTAIRLARADAQLTMTLHSLREKPARRERDALMKRLIKLTSEGAHV